MQNPRSKKTQSWVLKTPWVMRSSCSPCANLHFEAASGHFPRMKAGQSVVFSKFGRCRSSSGLRAPPLRAAAASAAATSGSLCCGRPRGPWLNAGVSFWVRYLWSPAGPGPRVALEVRGRLSAAPYVCERGMCAPLSRRHSGRELGMPLNYCTRYHHPPKQKAFRLWIAPRSRRDPRAVLAPVLGARRREHAGSASHRDGVPPLAPRALRAVHELGRYLPQSRHGMSMGCQAGQRWPRGARGRGGRAHHTTLAL